jgi:hypothetical protein
LKSTNIPPFSDEGGKVYPSYGILVALFFIMLLHIVCVSSILTVL